VTGLNKKLIGTTYPWEAKYLFIQFPYIPIICLALFHQTKTGPCVSSNSLLVCHVIFPCWHVLVPYPEDMTYMPMRRMILCILLSLVESAAFWVYFIGRTVFYHRCSMKNLTLFFLFLSTNVNLLILITERIEPINFFLFSYLAKLHFWSSNLSPISNLVPL